MGRPVRTLLAWLPALGYMGLIWVLSSMALKVNFQPVPFRDKGVHFVEYGALAVLLSIAFRGTWPTAPLRRPAFYAAVTTVLWGLLDEIHQAYVPGRSSDPWDLLADALGAIAGTLAFVLVTRLRAGKEAGSL